MDGTRETSIQVFRKWLEKTGTEIDASGVVSKACFDEWSAGRSSKSLSRTFQRSISAHIAGSDARQPFEPDEEVAILKVIRKKEQWPAFRGTELTIGCKGFRAEGYHERLRRLALSSTSALSTEPLANQDRQRAAVVLRAEDPTVSASAKRPAAPFMLPPNKVLRQARMEFPSQQLQIWSPIPGAFHQVTNMYGQRHSGMEALMHNTLQMPSGMILNQPQFFPFCYRYPMPFPTASRPFNEQTSTVPGDLSFVKGKP